MKKKFYKQSFGLLVLMLLLALTVLPMAVLAYVDSDWNSDYGLGVESEFDIAFEFVEDEENGVYPLREDITLFAVRTGAECTIDYTVQRDGAFLMAPQLDVTVTNDLAESYGYADKVTDDVSVLDVLVAAHIAKYGDGFTQANAQNYLVLDESGNISKAFNNSGFACTINGLLPHSAELNGTSYAVLPIAEAAVKTGDMVEFFSGQLPQSYISFTKHPNSKQNRFFSEYSITEAQLYFYLFGYNALQDGNKDVSQIKELQTEAAGMQLYLVDNSTGALSPLAGAAASAADGRVDFSFATAGDYLITAKPVQSNAGVTSLPLMHMTIFERPQIKDLYFFRDHNYRNAYVNREDKTAPPDPAGLFRLNEGNFAGNKLEGWSLNLPDSADTVNFVADPMKLENESFNATLAYTKGGHESRVRPSDGYITFHYSVRMPSPGSSFGSSTWCDSTVKYRIKVNYYATLSSLDIARSVNLDFDSALNACSAMVDSGQSGVAITPTGYRKNYTIKINGNAVESGQPYNLTYNWNADKQMVIPIEVSGDGLATQTYTLTLKQMPREAKPCFMQQPVDARYLINAEAEPLTVIASSSGNMTYQWYANTANSNQGGTAISGAVGEDYTPKTDKLGVTYYYCIATNGSEFTASEPAAVEINPDPTPTNIKIVFEDGSAVPADGYICTFGQTDGIKNLKVTFDKGDPNAEYTYLWKAINYAAEEYYQDYTFREEQYRVDTITPNTTNLLMAASGGRYYYCIIYYKNDFKNDRIETDKVLVKVNLPELKPEYAQEYITETPLADAEYMENESASKVKQLSFGLRYSEHYRQAIFDTREYQWYVSDTAPTNGAPIAGAKAVEGEEGKNAAYRPLTSHSFVGTKYYYCESTLTLQGKSCKVYSTVAAITVNPNENRIEVKLQGAGTKSEPYLLSTAEDFLELQRVVGEGLDTARMYFELTADVDMPTDWSGIGRFKPGTATPDQGVNMLPFSGNFNGGGHTLTFAEGSKALLFFARNATVENLNINAPYMNDYALLSNYVVDYGEDGNYNTGAPNTIEVNNVTLKSGSVIKKGGFLGGGGSGANICNFVNCTVEENVKIGYDPVAKASSGLSNVASFAGTLNGVITNCVSYADVYGVNQVGGIAGEKGQSMGPATVQNCAFLGNIYATGKQIGGIVAAGYNGGGTAPNTPVVTIKNCYVDAEITGADRVGGILGAEPGCEDCWDNGAGYIENNAFYGTIHSEGSCGAIIGFLKSFNKNQGVINCFYIDVCGVSKAIGKIERLYPDVDNPEAGCTAVTAEQLKDGSIVSLLNAGESSLHNWVQGDKYPVHGKAQPIIVGLTISGVYKTEYYIGEELDLSGIVFTAKWSDGSITNPQLDDVKISGFDNTNRGVQTLTAAYGAGSAQFSVTVLYKPVTPEEPNKPTNPDDSNKPAGPGTTPSNTIRVYFTLQGDSVHGAPTSDKDTHTLKNKNLQTWIGRKTMDVDLNATVKDVFEQALTEAGMTWRNPSGNYVEAITNNGATLAEFSNGNLSGWMYTLNGEHSDKGVAEQFLENGDVIVFHYTDDYTVERGSEQWSGGSGGAGGGKGTGDNAGSLVLTPGTIEGADGKNQATMTAKEITTAIDKAKSDSLTNIVIEPNVKGSAKNVALSLPVDSVKAIGDDKMGLSMNSRIGSLAISDAALKSIAAQAGGIDVRLIVENKDTKKDEVKTSAANALAQAAASLRGAAESLLANACVTEVTITSNNKAITSFDGHELTLYLPVSDKDLFTEGENYKVIVVSADGAVETIIGKCMKYNAQIVVQVKTNHLSTFIVTNETEKEVVVQAQNGAMNFIDVNESHWFYEAVKFVYEAGLMNGEGENTFNPQGNLNRAMLVTILHRLESTPEVTEANQFSDVSAGQWYTEAVIWASANGIVNGYEDGTFAPTNNVTREEMAAMLMRYAEYKGIDVSATKDISGYNDAAKVAAWAQQNIAWSNSAGLIQGDENNNLNPQGKATRAEAATILMRLVKNIAG